MTNDCKLSAAEQKRLANPDYARDSVQYGVHTKREVDDCISAGKPSTFEKLKGSLTEAFDAARTGVEKGFVSTMGLARDALVENPAIAPATRVLEQQRGGPGGM